jgi:ABC-2 type transport system permease protein
MVLVATTAGLSAGVALIATGGGAGDLLGALLTVGVHLPAGSVFVAVAAVAFGFAPRATTAIGWGALTIGLVVGQLGELFGLPDWLQSLSPLAHIPAVPIEDADPLPIVAMLLAAVGGVAVATNGFSRRDAPVS